MQQWLAALGNWGLKIDIRRIIFISSRYPIRAFKKYTHLLFIIVFYPIVLCFLLNNCVCPAYNKRFTGGCPTDTTPFGNIWSTENLLLKGSFFYGRFPLRTRACSIKSRFNDLFSLLWGWSHATSIGKVICLNLKRCPACFSCQKRRWKVFVPAATLIELEKLGKYA